MDEQIRNLLKKYLDDRCSEEELITIQEILRSGQYAEEWDAVLREDVERIMNENIREELNEERKDQLLDRILQSTKMNIHPFQRAKASIGLFPEWLKIAASVLILLTGGLALMIAFWSSSDGHFVATTAAGEQTEVFLKDGTRVLLNNQSTLRYPDEFDDEVREVYLQGDAFLRLLQTHYSLSCCTAEELPLKCLGHHLMFVHTKMTGRSQLHWQQEAC